MEEKFWQRSFKGDFINLGIGQGYMLTTPLHLSLIAGILASKGQYKLPYLVRNNELDFSIDVEIQEADWVKLNQALIDVVYSSNGTGYKIEAGNLNLAGKSGTAQVVDINSREEYDEVRKNINLRDHAIFIGYAPFDDPRYSIAVIVENGESGGRVAGPIARDVLRELLNDICLRTTTIIISLALIVLIGSLTVYSVTSIDIFYFFRFLLINIFAILLVTLIFNQINLNRILSVGWVLFLLNIIIVLSVEFLGSEVKGSRRWLDFGFLSLQPSEFMKITFALFTIQYLRFYSFKFNTFRTIFLLAVLFISAAPIIIQPDLGTGLVYILLGLMLLFICGMNRSYFVGMAGFGILFSPVIYSFGLTAYQKSRIISWFSSDQNLSEKWNILQSEISIGSGGLFGEGFLNSKQNEFNFLPEADTDFIFSIYAEQFGFLGVLSIFMLLGLFIVLTAVMSMEQKRLTDDLSPYFLGTYFCLVIGFSFLLNILMVSGLIPVVGLPLPFFTKGGSSLLCFSIMIGLIFSSRNFLR